MNLQATKKINIDVSRDKYISINAKQYDRNLRYILATCYREGELLPIDPNTCFASIRYRKPDGYGVFNSCEIKTVGEVLIEVTEQMLAVPGICYADLVIYESNLAVKVVENEDGTVEFVDEGNSGVISTMTFVIHVSEAVFDNEEIESSEEFGSLNDLLIQANKDYNDILTTSRKHKDDARGFMTTTEEYMTTTEGYMTTAEEYMTTTEEYMSAASDLKDQAVLAQKAAYGSMSAAADSADLAAASESATKGYKDEAATSATASANSADASAKSALWAKSYTIGGNTGLREDEATSNALYYYEQIKNLNEGITSGLTPSGTITFDELATAEKEVGTMYNISTNFTTDDTFREGAGSEYQAGTFVYYTTSGKWDCLVSTAVNIANVNEVEEYLGI